MSRSRRQRRRGAGGHPAKAAARRERDQARRDASTSEEARVAREIVCSAGELTAALDAEIWASQLLGTLVAARYELPFLEGAQADTALELGEPLLRRLARMGNADAAVAVLAFAEVDDGELGLRARELLDDERLSDQLPGWSTDIGASQIVAAARMHDEVFADGSTIFLESRHADGTTLVVGVMIDRNLGGMANDILLADTLDGVEATVVEHADDDVVPVRFERIVPGVAAGLILHAIEVTDRTWQPPVGEDYFDGRAIALLRAGQTPGLVIPDDPVEVSQTDRLALRDEFLASPEGAGFAPDGDEAWAAVLAIDFASDYAGGDPLRFSPTMVELFMLDWVPRKVLSSEALVGVLPAALNAWVSFVGRRRGMPEEALVVVKQAIADCAQEMDGLSDEPSLSGPAQLFAQAVRDAGLDLDDPEALERFIDGFTPDDGELPARSDVVLQLKITLEGVSRPPVWRRLALPAATRLDTLHRVIQAAFGWDGYHLHAFERGADRFGPADPELDLDSLDERDWAIFDLVASPGDRLDYAYDFGDDWRHEILVEEVLEPDSEMRHARLLTAKGACPPEDCGGVWGWADLKQTLNDPDDPRAAELREWLGLDEGDILDPTAVDLDAIRTRLAAVPLNRP